MALNLAGRPALLFLPASRAGAIVRARASAADLVILDLEDAVAEADKAAARDAAVAALGEAWTCAVAIRINGVGTPWHEADSAAVRGSRADFAVLPRAERAEDVRCAASSCAKPIAAMIETARGVLSAAAIAADAAALIAGTNDLAASLRLPADAGRASLQTALQTVVLAARATGIPCFDGVFNRLDDPAGFAAEAQASRLLGFDGKSLIHPDQVEPCQNAFAPGPAEVARARRLVEAASGGAQRFEGEMIERMHVEAAQRLLARNEAAAAR